MSICAHVMFVCTCKYVCMYICTYIHVHSDLNVYLFLTAVNVSPLFSRRGDRPFSIEVDVEEVEVTGEEYATMMRYPSTMSNHALGDIIEESDEEEEEGENEDKEEEEETEDERKLDEDRPLIDDEEYKTVTGTMRRRLIKRTPSVAVLNESETAQVLYVYIHNYV